MLAYVEQIQRKEKELNSSLLKHQQWSGIDMIDEIIELITKEYSSSIKIKSEGMTEKQF